MIEIFVLPIVGLALAAILNFLFPKAKFRGYDIIPFFLIYACQLITNLKHKPSFLPYGFILFFVLIMIINIQSAYKNKNLSFGVAMRSIWDCLAISSIIWYLGLVILMIIG